MGSENGDMIRVSPLMIERLRASVRSRNEAAERVAEAQDVRAQAKKTRDDRDTTLREMNDEGNASDKRLADAARDLSKAERIFDEKDRMYKSRQDHARKMEARLLAICDVIEKGEDPDLFEREIDTGDSWRLVQIADIVGDLQAQPFVKLGIVDVGHLLGAEKGGKLEEHRKDGELTKLSLAFVPQAVTRWLYDTKRGRFVPEKWKDLREKKDAEVPEIKPEKAAAEAEEPTDSEPAAA